MESFSSMERVKCVKGFVYMQQPQEPKDELLVANASTPFYKISFHQRPFQLLRHEIPNLYC